MESNDDLYPNEDRSCPFNHNNLCDSNCALYMCGGKISRGDCAFTIYARRFDKIYNLLLNLSNEGKITITR